MHREAPNNAATRALAPAAAAPALQPLPLPSDDLAVGDRAEQAVYALLNHVPSIGGLQALRQLAGTWTTARKFGPVVRSSRASMTHVLASDMIAHGLTPTDMVLLYAWSGAPGVGGFSLARVSASLLAGHFSQAGLALQGPVPAAFLHRPLAIYFQEL